MLSKLSSKLIFSARGSSCARLRTSRQERSRCCLTLMMSVALKSARLTCAVLSVSCAALDSFSARKPIETNLRTLTKFFTNKCLSSMAQEQLTCLKSSTARRKDLTICGSTERSMCSLTTWLKAETNSASLSLSYVNLLRAFSRDTSSLSTNLLAQVTLTWQQIFAL